jgi:hypothetical protein
MMSEAHRAIRDADFERRVSDDADAVYVQSPGGWRFIPVQAFADEAEILACASLTPEHCHSVDAWWSVSGDAAFVSVRTLAAADSRAPGLYARNRGHPAEWIDLLAVLDAPFITRPAFESLLSAFVALGFPTSPRFTLSSSRAFQLLGTLDGA